jgi:hypothetical protein
MMIFLAILARILHEQSQNITENIRRYRLLLVFYFFKFIFSINRLFFYKNSSLIVTLFRGALKVVL